MENIPSNFQCGFSESFNAQKCLTGMIVDKKSQKNNC